MPAIFVDEPAVVLLIIEYRESVSHIDPDSLRNGLGPKPLLLVDPPCREDQELLLVVVVSRSSVLELSDRDRGRDHQKADHARDAHSQDQPLARRAAAQQPA